MVVLAGPSGSGKSTRAKALLAEAHDAGLRARIFSADDHFVGKDGVYLFDPRRLPQAHGQCLRRYLVALADAALDVAIVDNTNTTLMELAKYVEPALAFGAIVRIEIAHYRPPAELAARNVHGVPVEAIEAQRQRLAKTIWQLAELPWWPKFTYFGPEEAAC